ncbi:MAG: hypothetical protein U9N45_00295 [Gemmatimonadota bacterium]|nr:hypothetical protein [Gemmatimonadota bacterium]
MLRSISILFLLLACTACNRSGNNPRRLVDRFLEAVRDGSMETLDNLVDWKGVVVTSGYVTGSYFSAQQDEKKNEITEAFKIKFSSDCMPLITRSVYRVKSVYVSRDDCDARIEITFPEDSQHERNEPNKHDFTLRMKLDRERGKWYITDFGDLINLHILRGDFDPEHFYLSKPVHP